MFALLLGGCVEKVPSNPNGIPEDVERVVDMSVPASFDWKTTAPVACEFTAPHLSRVYVAAQRGAEPFASFMVGDGADAVKLDLPVTAKTLSVSCETENGLSPQAAVPVAGSAVSYALASNGKDYTGIEDGDKNTTIGDVIYMPASGWGTLLFEDLWPSYGDFDFNDFVINYKVQLHMNNKNKVWGMHIGVRVKAVGGSLPYDLCLAMKGVKGGEIDGIEPVEMYNTGNARLVALNSANYVKDPAVLRFENIRTNPNRQSGAAYVNTEEGFEMTEAQLVNASFFVEFRNSIAIGDVAFDTFDFFLSRERDGNNIEIHMGGFEPTPDAELDYAFLKAGSAATDKAGDYYYSNDRLVWALNIPHDIRHAYEKVDFLKAYPEMADWAQSGGAKSQDWYLHGVEQYLVRKK